MWPRCDPTIHTAPTHLLGRVSSAWVFLAMGTKNLGTMVTEAVMGFEIHHGVGNTPWGEKCKRGGAKEGACVRCYTGWPTQLGRPLRLWRASPPSPRHCVGLLALTRMLLRGKERERAAYFLCPSVHRFLARSMAVVTGPFVPLAFIAFFLLQGLSFCCAPIFLAALRNVNSQISLCPQQTAWGLLDQRACMSGWMEI